MRLPRVRLIRDLRARIALGHPWIYRAAVAPAGATPAPGSIVDVVDPSDRFVARGFFDPTGSIGVRVLTRDADEPIDAEFVRARVGSACAVRRAAAHLLDTDAVRLLHGEADFVPGLVLDRYATTGVIRFDGPAAGAFWRPLVMYVQDACAEEGFPCDRLWARGSRGDGESGEAIAGDPPAPVEIREGAARFEVDVVRGQKTGFFLDQRANRRVVARLAAGAEVLNLFAYTGGFSVAAALAGARRVTTVDLARPAIDAARRNLERNGLDPAAHELACADAFAYLAEAARAGRRWDVVVCDPPSFAPNERARPRALAAYRDLNRAAARAVAPGGVLATASCSSHVGLADFWTAVASGLDAAGRQGRVVDVRGADVDHPIVPAFPEGRYLKLLLVYLP